MVSLSTSMYSITVYDESEPQALDTTGYIVLPSKPGCGITFAWCIPTQFSFQSFLNRVKAQDTTHDNTFVEPLDSRPIEGQHLSSTFDTTILFLLFTKVHLCDGGVG